MHGNPIPLEQSTIFVGKLGPWTTPLNLTVSPHLHNMEANGEVLPHASLLSLLSTTAGSF